MQRDYILRVIEQIADVIAGIRRRILGGDATARPDLRAEASRYGVDLGLARAVEIETLVGLLSPGGVPEPARCWTMAEFLYLDGLAAERSGNLEECIASYERALRLYLALDPRMIGGLPEATDRVQEIEERLAALTP